MSDHGTVSRYTSGRCRCALCRTAMSDYKRAWQAVVRSEPIPEGRHGRSSTYTERGCRCEPCKAARNAYLRAWRAS